MRVIPAVFTVREVMKLLKLSRSKVYILIEEGTLEGFKLGADWRITRVSVERLVGPVGEPHSAGSSFMTDAA